MKTVIIVLMFFLIGGLLIISNNNLAMYNPENISTFSHHYSEWLNQIYVNSQSITGEIIKQDWLPN